MPKLPTLTPKKLIQVLESNNFILDRVSGSHYIFYNSVSGNRAVVPVHNKDIPKGTLNAILKEAGINRENL